MIFWEIRKSINVIFLLSAVVLCGIWFFVCRNFFVVNYEDINGEIYRSYIDELSALPREEQRKYIENEGLHIRQILSLSDEIRTKYLHGEISDDEYLKYLDSYDSCRAKSATFNFIEMKFARISENPKLRLFYDLELEGYLTTMTADFPLIILLAIAGCGVFISDIPTEPFVKTCKNGRNKTFFAKLSATLIIGAILIFAFNFAELAALFSKDLGDLTAPAASMDNFAALDSDITCFSLIFQTFLYRIIGEFCVCIIFFMLSRLCRNYAAFFSASAAVVAIPAFFVKFLPAAVRGIIVYYSLSGNTILLDNNGFSVYLWSAGIILISLITAIKCRRI